MGDRRMFSRKITDSARFLKMPASTQALYFHLGLHADDDGVVEGFSVMQMANATEDELRILVLKGFVTLLNEDFVAFINDWKEHNCIRADRKTDSVYKDLLHQIMPEIDLVEPKERAYKRKNKQLAQVGPANDGPWPDNGPPKISKDKLSKDNIHSPAEPDEGASFCKEVLDYLNQKMGTRYKSTTKKNRELIRARKREGYGLEDFKKVVDVKCDEWNHPPRPGEKDMRKFIRPETLFGTKFESYLNQPGQAQPCEPTEEGDIW